MTDVMPDIGQETGAEDGNIRPFQVNIPEAEITELRSRIKATRWPERRRSQDNSQGVQLATVQELAIIGRPITTGERSRRGLTPYRNFITEIDGLDIHFIHVRSKHENAMPIIVTHGWPGSIIEQMKLIEPLTNPTAHGGSAADAFHIVIPSMPGYGYSGKPTRRDGNLSALHAPGRTDDSSWLHEVCGAGRRLGCDRR